MKELIKVLSNRRAVWDGKAMVPRVELVLITGEHHYELEQDAETLKKAIRTETLRVEARQDVALELIGAVADVAGAQLFQSPAASQDAAEVVIEKAEESNRRLRRIVARYLRETSRNITLSWDPHVSFRDQPMRDRAARLLRHWADAIEAGRLL